MKAYEHPKPASDISGMREYEEVQMYDKKTGAMRNIKFSGKELGQHFELHLNEYNR